MNRGDLREFTRAYNGALNTQKATDTFINKMLAKAAEEVAAAVIALPHNEKFASATDTGTYNLVTSLTGYLTMDKPGVWFNTGTVANPDWKQLKPRTLKWLDEKRPNWRTEASGEPIYFAVHKHQLHLVPAPDSTLSDAIWVYFGQKPYTVADDDEFYFYGSSEYPHLSILDDCILAYMRWKGLGILGKEDNYRRAELDYKREIAMKESMLRRNLAINYDRETKMQGKKVR